MWGVKEVVTAVLFSALMIVVMFVVGSVTMLGVDFSMLFMAATYVLVVAPLYMLMVMRVNRFGVTAFYACVMALVYLMFGKPVVHAAVLPGGRFGYRCAVPAHGRAAG